MQTITMPTSLGDAEATRDRGKWGHGSNPWEIKYPWGGDKFYGTVTEVKNRMKKNIDNNQDQEI